MGKVTDTESRGAGSHDEAERWFVRLLEPNCPEAERAAFERWRAANPAHAAAYRQVERLWAQGEEAVRDPAVMTAAMRALHHSEPAPSPVRRWFLSAAAVAAAAVIAVVVVPRWLAVPEPPPGTRYATVVGEQRELALPDGSVVMLDTATVLVERYSERERRVDLQQGQAQFQVQGDPARPFVLHAQGGTITAIGTAFQVRVGDDETLVTLLEGQLAIITEPERGAPRQSAHLAAGEQLAFDRAGRIGPVRAVDLKAARGWTEGKLFVDDWRLEDLLAEMNRYSGTRLRLGDSSLRDIRISGIFRTGDQDTLALVLQQGWAIHAERRSDEEVVLSRK